MHTQFPVAVHIFLLRENHVLLLQRANTGYEEVGVHLRSPDLTVAGVMHRLSNDERIDFFLVATTWSGSVTNQEPDKCSGLRWCALDALPANTVPYVQAALKNFRQGVWFAEFGWPPVGS